MGLSEEEKKRKQLLIDSIINQTYKPSKPKVETNQTERTQTLTDSIINHSYVQKKPRIREENTTKIRNNNNQEKSIASKILDPLSFIGEKTIAGTFRNIVGIPQAGLTDIANNLEKGEQKSTSESTTDFLTSLLSFTNPLQPLNNAIKNVPENISNTIDILKDKDKTVNEKISDIGLNASNEALEIIPGKDFMDNAIQLAGNIGSEDIKDTVLDVNNKISEPIENWEEELAEESMQYGDVINTIANVGGAVGGMIPSIAMATVNPALGLSEMGVSVKGQATQEALKKGAKLNEAVKIGNAKGMAEVGTEMLSGGINIFGKGALDDILQRGIIDKVQNKVAKELVKQGVNAGGEVLEETITDLIGTVIDQGTVDPNASYTLQDWSDTAITTTLSTFVLNALSRGMVGGINAINTNKSANEAIANTEEQLGRKLTNKEKQDLRKQVKEFIAQNNNGLTQEDYKSQIDILNKQLNQSNTIEEQRTIMQQIEALNNRATQEGVETNIIPTEQAQLQQLQNDKIALQNELANTAEPALQATLQQQIEKIDDQINEINNSNELANNDNVMYNNGNESVGGINDRVQQQGVLGSNNQLSRVPKEKSSQQSRKFTRAEYEQWEQNISSIDDTELNNEQRTIKDNIKKQYNKDIVFFDGSRNNNTYTAGASYSDNHRINIDVNQAKKFGTNKLVYHETLESDILHNKSIKEDIIEPALQKIINDPNFEQQKQEFWNNQNEDMPNDYLIAKEILCDRFAEIKTGEQWDYKNVLSQETNTTMDLAIDTFYKEIDNKASNNADYINNIDKQITDLENQAREKPLLEKRDILKQINTLKNEKLALEQGYNSYEEYIATQSNSNNTNNAETNITNKELEQSSSFNLKQKQNEIIQRSNPVQDDYHTWIRSVEDIKTFEETLQDSDWEGWEGSGFDPDYTADMANEALEKGEITVYSSYPIEDGIFVTPSRMEAESYSGNGQIYEKTVKLTDIAWIDPTQGQYAKVENIPSVEKKTNLQDIAPVQARINTEQNTSSNQQIIPQENKTVQNENMGQIKEKQDITIIDSNIYENVSSKKRHSTLNEVLKHSVRGSDYFVDGEKIIANNTTIGKLANGHTNYSKNIDGKTRIELKANIINNIKEVVENSIIYKANRIDTKGHTFADSFDMRKSLINYKGKNYEVTFNVGKKNGRNTLYGIESVKKTQKNKLSYSKITKKLSNTNNGIEPTKSNTSIAPIKENVNQTSQNQDIAPVKGDSSTPYRNIARANKLIKKKNSRIRQIESDMQQVTTPEAKNALQRQIDTIEEEYNNRIQKLYDGVNETSQEFTQEDYTNTVGENYTVDKSYEPKDGVYTDTSQYTPELYNNTLIEQTKQKAIKNSGLAQELTAPVREVQSENKSSLTDAWRQLRQFVTNKNASIDDLAKETGNKEIRYKGDRLNDISRTVSVDINVAQTDNNGHKIGKSLRELFDWARENDLYDDFNNYLIHQSNIERARHGKGLQNISEWQSKEIVKAYEETYPEFIERAQEVHQYSKNMLQNAVDAGRFTQELANLLSNNLYENYVPFFEVAGSLYNISPEEIKAGNPIKLAKGGADIQNISPIESSLEKQTYAYKSAILRNELYKEIVNTLQTVENTNNLQYIKNGTDNIAQSLLSDTDNFMQDRDGNKFLTAFVKGEPVTVQISQELYENLNRQVEDVVRVAEQKMSSFLKPLQTANTIYGKMLTTWSLTFPMANAIKDIQDATLNSKHTMDFIKYFTTGKTFSDIKNNSDAWQQFRLLYGTNVAEAQAGTGNIGRNIGSNNRFLNAVSSINELIELIPRYTEFKVSLDNGASITEALYNAKEVTTNFGRGGILTKALNRNGATFLNASVQGFSRFIRNFTEAYTEDGANGVAKMFVKAIMLGIAPAVLNHMLFGLGDDKDDEYQALPDYIKDNYYLIKYGDGSFIRIPKGRMLSVFGSSAIRTLETIEGKENAFDGWFTNAWTQSGANNPVEDNLFSGLLDTMRGETWYGTDLVPSRLEDELPKNQYDEKIDKFSIWLGEQFNISPYKINYLLQQYGGSIADIVLPMITPETKTANEDNPLGVLTSLFEDKFTANSTFDNRYAGEFYDLKDELTAIANDSQSTEKDKLKKLYLDDINSELGKLYEEKRNLQANESMTNSEKYSKVATIQAQINQIAYDALNNYEDVENYSNYATVSEKEYMLNTNDEGEKYWAKIKDELLEDINSLGLQSTGKNEYLKTYTKVGDIYYNEELEYEAKRNKVTNIIINSKLSDDAKANMYNKHYSNEKTYNLISNINIDFNTYANSIIAIDQIKDQYANQDDMTSKQKTAQGKVRKKAVQQYINSLNLDIGQKLIMENILGGYSVNNSKTYLRQYIETLPLSKEEKQELDKKLFN